MGTRGAPAGSYTPRSLELGDLCLAAFEIQNQGQLQGKAAATRTKPWTSCQCAFRCHMYNDQEDILKISVADVLFVSQEPLFF